MEDGSASVREKEDAFVEDQSRRKREAGASICDEA